MLVGNKMILDLTLSLQIIFQKQSLGDD
jgi:hypothetical protein